MKNNKHIQSFNEHQENLNISDVSHRNLWNEMIEIRDKNKGTEIAKKADMLLSQYNTAGGIRIKDEILNFIDSYGD